MEKEHDMATVCITGANRGIGLELARQYRDRGDQVIAACRKSSDALAELGIELAEGVDVADGSGIAALVEAIGDRKLDILINNAGVLSKESLEDLDIDRIRHQFEINSLGPLRVTAALRPKLGRGSKVAIVTSRMGSIEDNTSGGSYGYRMSKAAVNMAGRSLAHDLAPDGIAVVILHPGFVRTDMTGQQGFIDAPESAAGLIARIDELSLDSSGSFLHTNGDPLPW
jgi:NAD(P)-dependent dehydrogenase (short-subunit alcohol dehydrogenase family)